VFFLTDFQPIFLYIFFMRLSCLVFITSLGLLLSATPPSTPKPIQSLQLSKSEKLGGTLALPNLNTLLFIPDNEKNSIRVLSISAAGKQLWESSIVKTYHIRGLIGFKRSLGEMDRETRASLSPVQVFSAGNVAYACETIFKGNPMKLKENQLVVQLIDEQGKVIRHDFTQPAPPKKEERAIMGRYADSDGLYQVTKHTNVREETAVYFLEQYNPVTKKSQQLALDLPKPYATKRKELAYNDWILAGHKAGKTFFYRALRGTTEKDNPNKIPVEYEFRTYDNTAKQLSGFVTTLHQKLQPNTFINCSGLLSQYPMQGHVPELLEKTSSNGRSYSSVTYDTHEFSTAGLGKIYIDPDSEHIYIAGEYGTSPFNPTSTPPQYLTGTFIFKLTPDGSILASNQTAYSPEIKKDRQFLEGSYYDQRWGTWLADPVTHTVGLAFEQAKRNVVVTYDANLQLIKQQTITFKKAPLSSLWLMGNSAGGAAYLGVSMMEIPRQYAASAQTGFARKVHELAARTATPVNDDIDENPMYYCQPLPNDGALIVRGFNKLGTQIDIYAL
jgi:hypothetical protein